MRAQYCSNILLISFVLLQIVFFASICRFCIAPRYTLRSFSFFLALALYSNYTLVTFPSFAPSHKGPRGRSPFHCVPQRVQHQRRHSVVASSRPACFSWVVAVDLLWGVLSGQPGRVAQAQVPEPRGRHGGLLGASVCGIRLYPIRGGQKDGMRAFKLSALFLKLCLLSVITWALFASFLPLYSCEMCSLFLSVFIRSPAAPLPTSLSVAPRLALKS